MSVELLKTFLRRLKKSEFVDFLKEWGRLPDTAEVFTLGEDGGSVSKRLLVSTALRDCKDAGVSGSDVDEFALLHIYSHSKSKQWTTFQIEKDEENIQHKSLTPAALKQKLWKELSKYFTLRICLLCRDDAFWMRIAITGETALTPETIVYAIHFPHTNYFFTTNIKVALEEYISQAFASAVGGISVAPINLRGKCVYSLAQLSVGKASQGSFSKFKLNQVDANPLATQKRKRKDTEEEEFDVNAIAENVQERKRRHTLLENTFGSNIQPTLEKVTYEMETNFAGLEFAPGMAQNNGAFRCKVKFEGKSVIEGMRQLGKAGLADMPMKPHVGRIHSYAQNRFLLRRKERRHANSRA